MPVNTKAIRRRIKSVGNTRKITKALEMVSAAKMRRAVDAAVNTRSYATMARQILDLLKHVNNDQFPLLRKMPVERALVVLISSNRGLCGSYNSNVFKKTRNLLAESEKLGLHEDEALSQAKKPEIHVIGVGRKSADFARKNGYKLEAVFDNLSERPRFEEILPVCNFAVEEYKKGIYQKIFISYTDYKSSLTQEPRMIQLLPITVNNVEDLLQRLGKNESGNANENGELILEKYIFEPGINEILEIMLPRLVEIQLYQTILESAASEHSARMLAMRNASDAAADTIKDLQLTFNKARQAAITQEISEIVGGAAALE